MEPVRLQKYLAGLGVASRREAEKFLSQGRIAINGQLVLQPGVKVTPGEDVISIDGRPVRGITPPKVYWLLHKPRRTITGRSDPQGRPTIFDLPALGKSKLTVNPVGRLDFDSEGLLLLTNDGELNNRLCHPRHKVPRHYQVKIRGRLTPEQEDLIRQGVRLEDGPCLPTDLVFAHREKVGSKIYSWYFMTVFEGRNRLIRRTFQACGLPVTRLVRYGFGDLRLTDEVPRGTYRQLTAKEIRALKRAAHLASGSED